jgi:hypothetical protein
MSATIPTAVRSERARSILGDLIRQRQLMRSDPADEGLLEANRLAIVYWQWELSRSLLVEHGQRSQHAA